MKKMLMLGTGSMSCEMVTYAKSKGIYTIVTDTKAPEDSKAKLLSDEYWMIDPIEIDTLEKKCIENNITAITTGNSEFRLEICLELCKRLHLPYYCNAESWHYSRDKEDFKKLCKKNGVPVAQDYYVSEKLTEEELEKVVFPVVVKPVDLAGNRGISYCYNKEELKQAYRYARSLSQSDKIIVERMLHGNEWYSSYAFSNGEVRLLALNAMYSQPGEPKNCYTITTTVSEYVERYIEEINPKIEKVLKEVGCKEGYAWVQVMLDEDGHFYVLEMGYRLDGDHMYIPYMKMLNYNAVEEIVNCACGEKSSVDRLPLSQTHPFTQCGCGMMLWTNKGGILSGVNGIEELERNPYFHVQAGLKLGTKIEKYKAIATIAFVSKNCDEMCEAINHINKTVSFYNEKGEDMVIKYTDFDYLKKIYNNGLKIKS